MEGKVNYPSRSVWRERWRDNGGKRLENAGWGGANAGPVARAMLDEYLLRDTWELKHEPQP